MRVLIAADKFKGSLSAADAGEAIRRGLERAGAGLEFSMVPVADGGEGMARVITEAKGGEWVEAETEDALGRPIRTGYGWIASESVAVIEMAEASGLWRLGDGERDPWRASTFGTGLLMRHAVSEKGAERMLLGIGGSATNDGGCGMARALGYRFLGEGGDEVDDLPADLETVIRIDRGPAAVSLPRVKVACDVTNPVLGEAGCTRVYGPQKGIARSDFEKHERRLRHLIALTGSSGVAAAESSGAGAAGGLGWGCRVFLDAALRPGFERVAEILALEAAVEACDLVVTGEGRLDAQTLRGKAPAGVAALARRHGKAVVVFAGAIEPGSRKSLATVFDAAFQIAPEEMPAADSMARGAELLEVSVSENAEKILALANSLHG